jgi:hypothetical protein
MSKKKAFPKFIKQNGAIYNFSSAKFARWVVAVQERIELLEKVKEK